MAVDSLDGTESAPRPTVEILGRDQLLQGIWSSFFLERARTNESKGTRSRKGEKEYKAKGSKSPLPGKC